ncbi:MAG: hypothetical protein ACE5G7_04830 [Candidatus Hydrothermarchaeaceae archaeon]
MIVITHERGDDLPLIGGECRAMVESIKKDEWKILKELIVRSEGWFVPGLSVKMKQKIGDEGETEAR